MLDALIQPRLLHASEIWGLLGSGVWGLLGSGVYWGLGTGVWGLLGSGVYWGLGSTGVWSLGLLGSEVWGLGSGSTGVYWGLGSTGVWGLGSGVYWPRTMTLKKFTCNYYACKRFVNISLRAPNSFVYDELGRFPLVVNWFDVFFSYQSLSGISDVSSPPPPPSPTVWNLRATSLIPIFYISSLVLLPSLVSLSVLSFSAFGLFS